MANAIYTTNSKTIAGASSSNPKIIPSPVRNADIQDIIEFDNGSIGGVFATVRASRGVGYNLFFLPNLEFRDTIIVGETVGEVTLNFADHESDHWKVLEKNGEKLLVNDITKLQGNDNAISSNFGSRKIPQDVLLVLHDSNKKILSINNIISVTNTEQRNFLNVESRKSIDSDDLSIIHSPGGASTDNVFFKIDLRGALGLFTYTQEEANREHTRSSKYTNLDRVKNFDINSAGFPEMETQKQLRWGPVRNKLIFQNAFMAAKAMLKMQELTNNYIRTTLIPGLRSELIRFRSLTTKSDESVKEQVDFEIKELLEARFNTTLSDEQISKMVVSKQSSVSRRKNIKLFFSYFGPWFPSSDIANDSAIETINNDQYLGQKLSRVLDSTNIANNKSVVKIAPSWTLLSLTDGSRGYSGVLSAVVRQATDAPEQVGAAIGTSSGIMAKSNISYLLGKVADTEVGKEILNVFKEELIFLENDTKLESRVTDINFTYSFGQIKFSEYSFDSVIDRFINKDNNRNVYISFANETKLFRLME